MQKAAILDKAPARVKRTPVPTYDRWVLTSLVPAMGWQSVFYDDDGTHQLPPVHALALGHRRRYAAHTGQVVRAAWLGPDDEAWEIVALAYDVADGWTVLDEASNFCGLLPPSMTLDAFEQGSLCCWQHAAPR